MIEYLILKIKNLIIRGQLKIGEPEVKLEMTYDPEIHHRRSIRLKGYDYSRAGLYFITICTQSRLHLLGKIENGAMILNDAGRMVATVWNEIPQHYSGFAIHEFVVMPNHIHGIIEIMAMVGAGPRACPGGSCNHRDGSCNRRDGSCNHRACPDGSCDRPGGRCNCPIPERPRNGQPYDTGQRCDGQRCVGQPQGVAPTEIPVDFSVGMVKTMGSTAVNLPNVVQRDGQLCNSGQLRCEHQWNGQPHDTGQRCDGQRCVGQPQGVAPTEIPVDISVGMVKIMGSTAVNLPDIVHRFKTLTTKRYTDGVKQCGWVPFPGRLWQRNYYEHIIRNENSYQMIAEYIVNNPANWSKDGYYGC
ncbi:transposase [Hydrogenispora ethanolica]|nr:transposase [Hydrogenispora ethanolica]